MNEISMQSRLNSMSSAVEPKAVTGSVKGEAKVAIDVKPEQEVAPFVDQNKQPPALEQKAETLRVTNEQIESSIAKLNDYLQNSQRKLEFKVDEDSGETVVRVYKQHSDELIRQIPNEEAVALADKLSSEEPLMLFSAQV